MVRMVAYAYLSAAADFEVSQVVDKTVGVHGVITKAHFT
jgi:acetamidase/formamidase